MKYLETKSHGRHSLKPQQQRHILADLNQKRNLVLIAYELEQSSRVPTRRNVRSKRIEKFSRTRSTGWSRDDARRHSWAGLRNSTNEIVSPLSARAWARALPGQKSESAGQRNWNAWPGVERLKPIDRCTTVDRLYPRNSSEMKFFFRSFETFINRSIVESTRSLNFPIEFFFHAREIRRTRIESKYLQHEEPITLIRSANKFLAE